MTPRFRHRLEHALFKGVVKVLSSLPRTTVVAMGEALGSLAWRLDARHRRVMRENLRAADLGLSEDEVIALSKACFRHFGGVLMSVVPMMTASAEELDAWIVVEGLEHFDAAKAEGKGFIQLTGHYGHWEAIALAQSRHGRSLAVIGRELDNPLLDPELRAFRERFGNRQIDKEGAMKETLKAFKAGEGVGFLLDQDALTMGVFVRFMGQWASTYATAGALAAKFDLPVLPVFSWPEPDGRIRVRFEAPFKVPRTGQPDRDAWVATQMLVGVIEHQVRKDPRWWFWMHNRFKTQPGIGHPPPAPLPPKEWLESFTALPSN
jgi:KDO2-lipid IV(A) lauroyltransferase